MGRTPLKICLHVDSLEHSKPPKAVPLLRFCTPNIGSAVMRSILHLTFLLGSTMTLMGFSLLFSVLERGGIVGTPTRQFVQILHTGGNHWVTASNRFAENNEVCIYDSLSTMLDSNTEQALSWMLRPKEHQFVVTFPTVQQQTNSSNCDLLAIGFEYALCSNIRPENCQFREGRMRAELIKCFRTGKIEFKIEATLRKQKFRQTTVSVHCVCRTAHNKEVMVQCSLCHGWYHPTCLNIPSNAMFGEDDWHCQNCKEA